MTHPSPPTAEDIQSALHDTRYDGAKNIAFYNDDTAEADFEAANNAVLNAARAVSLERALRAILETRLPQHRINIRRVRQWA